MYLGEIDSARFRGTRNPHSIRELARQPCPKPPRAAELRQGLLGDIGRVLTEVKPDAVRVLLPEQTYEDSYARIAPRAALETLVCLASLDAGVPVEMLRRISARSRLGMPKGGRFESHIPAIVGEPVGKYWNAGRNLASAAALAEH